MADPASRRVDVWIIDTKHLDPSAAWLRACTLDAERERARHYVSERERRAFLIGRATRRWLLGHYTGIRPEDLLIREADRGKPYLAGHGLAFSSSRAGTLAVHAVADRGSLGVDVEVPERAGDPAAWAGLVLAPEEATSLARASKGERRHLFLAIWTAKEAYLKAAGLGLHDRLAGLSVDVAGTAPALRYDRTGYPTPGPLRFAALDPDPGHVGTVAMPVGCTMRVRAFDAERHRC